MILVARRCPKYMSVNCVYVRLLGLLSPWSKIQDEHFILQVLRAFNKYYLGNPKR